MNPIAAARTRNPSPAPTISKVSIMTPLDRSTGSGQRRGRSLSDRRPAGKSSASSRSLSDRRRTGRSSASFSSSPTARERGDVGGSGGGPGGFGLAAGRAGGTCSASSGGAVTANVCWHFLQRTVFPMSAGENANAAWHCGQWMRAGTGGPPGARRGRGRRVTRGLYPEPTREGMTDRPLNVPRHRPYNWQDVRASHRDVQPDEDPRIPGQGPTGGRGGGHSQGDRRGLARRGRAGVRPARRRPGRPQGTGPRRRSRQGALQRAFRPEARGGEVRHQSRQGQGGRGGDVEVPASYQADRDRGTESVQGPRPGGRGHRARNLCRHGPRPRDRNADPDGLGRGRHGHRGGGRQAPGEDPQGSGLPGGRAP